MANHTSAIKSIRKNKSKHILNCFHFKSARTDAKKLRIAITVAIQKGKFEEKELLINKYQALISSFDKLAKKKIIHKNKASHLKSKMAHFIASFFGPFV